MPASPHITSVALAQLRPTQISVGLAEVADKQAEWSRLGGHARAQLLGSHCFPCVRGPGGAYYVVDHHHLGLALLREGQAQCWVTVLDDFSDTAGQAFWRLMEFRRWAHPYDEQGRRRDFSAIPAQLEGLRDDPYRSLAGFVRRAGGYAKVEAPFAEFLWADYLRDAPALAALATLGALGALGGAAGGDITPDLLAAALQLAHADAACHLPGWLPSAAAAIPVAAAAAAVAGAVALVDAADATQRREAPGKARRGKGRKDGKGVKDGKAGKAGNGKGARKRASGESLQPARSGADAAAAGAAAPQGAPDGAGAARPHGNADPSEKPVKPVKPAKSAKSAKAAKAGKSGTSGRQDAAGAPAAPVAAAAPGEAGAQPNKPGKKRHKDRKGAPPTALA